MKTLYYILLFLVSPQITTAQVGADDSCVEAASCTIPYDHLATQESDRFYFWVE